MIITISKERHWADVAVIGLMDPDLYSGVKGNNSRLTTLEEKQDMFMLGCAEIAQLEVAKQTCLEDQAPMGKTCSGKALHEL